MLNNRVCLPPPPSFLLFPPVAGLFVVFLTLAVPPSEAAKLGPTPACPGDVATLGGDLPQGIAVAGCEEPATPGARGAATSLGELPATSFAQTPDESLAMAPPGTERGALPRGGSAWSCDDGRDGPVAPV